MPADRRQAAAHHRGDVALNLDGRAVAQVARAVEADPAMPLVERVSRHLGVASWTLRLDDQGRLRGITVLGALSPPAEPAPPPIELPPPLERLYPLSPGGPLARLVGSATATGRQLADLALRQNDPEIRGEAVRVAVDAMMRDPALERTLLGTLDALSDAALADLVASAGGGASGLVSVVAERARGRPLGRRAAALLARLGGP